MYVTTKVDLDYVNSFTPAESFSFDDWINEQDLSDQKKQQTEKIAVAYAALTDKQKKVFQLCYMDGVTQTVAKDIMGISLKSCSNLHARMIKKLKAEIERKQN